MSERSRGVLFQRLAQVLDDEEAVAELLSFFPARDDEAPVTQAHLASQLAPIHGDLAAIDHRFEALEQRIRAESASLRGEMAALGSDLRGEMAALGSDLRGEMAALGSDLRAEMAALGSDLRAEMAGQREQSNEQFQQLILRIADSQRLMIQWTLGALVSLLALVVAVGLFTGP